jgi:hypothetical protein
MSNPLNLTDAEIDALRALQAGRDEPAANDPIWDELEQFGLVESREYAHTRVLSAAGEEYLAERAASEPGEATAP